MKKHIHKNTAGYNLMWESSRMMLPEHKEAIIKMRQESKKQIRPHLDEQEMEEISMVIAESYSCKVDCTLVLFGEYENEKVTGTIERIDQQLKQVKLNGEWVKLNDIINAYIE